MSFLTIKVVLQKESVVNVYVVNMVESGQGWKLIKKRKFCWKHVLKCMYKTFSRTQFTNQESHNIFLDNLLNTVYDSHFSSDLDSLLRHNQNEISHHCCRRQRRGLRRPP